MEQETGFSSIRKAQEAYGANFLIEGKIMRLDFTDITHAGLVSGITIIYTRNKKYRTDYDLTALMNLLPAELFVRISRDFIVAPAHVDRVENYMVIVGRYRFKVNYFYRNRVLAALDAVEPKPPVQIIKYKT